MLSIAETGAPALLQAHQAPYHIGAVTLRVQDLTGLTTFYRDAIGLSVIRADTRSTELGVDGKVLLRLVAGALRPTAATGLFHLAILLPSRQALANWLRHAAETRIRLEGASDHLVSEALYLSDPEGNGIEIYRDRQRAEWPRRPDGGIAMATDRLDLDRLLKEARGEAYAGMPSGTAMGHIHLRVGDTAEAEAFYHGLIGFDVMVHYPGASFLASGGYHHHIAGNIWGSRGAGARKSGEAGLDSFEIVARDAGDFEAMRSRMLAAGGRETDGVPTMADPWNNRIVLTR
jgi:catechol 2,3-dioxygenase